MINTITLRQKSYILDRMIFVYELIEIKFTNFILLKVILR